MRWSLCICLCALKNVNILLFYHCGVCALGCNCSIFNENTSILEMLLHNLYELMMTLLSQSNYWESFCHCFDNNNRYISFPFIGKFIVLICWAIILFIRHRMILQLLSPRKSISPYKPMMYWGCQIVVFSCVLHRKDKQIEEHQKSADLHWVSSVVSYLIRHCQK